MKTTLYTIKLEGLFLASFNVVYLTDHCLFVGYTGNANCSSDELGAQSVDMFHERNANFLSDPKVSLEFGQAVKIITSDR